MEAYLEFFQGKMSDVDKLKLVLASITRTARRILIADKNASQSLEKVHAKLKSVFVADTDWATRLIDTTQKTDEDAQTFATRIRLAVINAFSYMQHLDTQIIEKQSLIYFVKNARPEVRTRLRIQMPATIEIAIKGAMELEINEQEKYRK